LATRTRRFSELRREALEVERWNMLHPGETARVPYVTQCLNDAPGVLVAASDYVKSLPDSIDRWLPRPLVALGTDGYGRSEGRAGLREFFEVDYRYVVLATLGALARDKKIDISVVQQAIKTHNINPEKSNPAIS
jgi:pyruvate dehydrogenase E1 component